MSNPASEGYTSRRPLSCLVLGVIVLSQGCTQVSREAGFSEVQEQVRQRSGYTTRWQTLDEDEQRLEDHLDKVLSDDLTAEEAVQIALVNNPELQAVYERLAIRRADLIQAGLLHNPVLDAEIKFVESGGGEVVELSLVQPILELLFIPMRREVAEAEFEAEKFRVTRWVLDLAGRTRRGFYRLQAAEQLAQMLRSVVGATRSSVATAEALFQAGNIRELDRKREQAIYEQARQRLAGAQLAVEVARQRLNELMGMWGQRVDWRIRPRLPELPRDSHEPAKVERQAVAASLDIAASRRQLNALGRRLGLTKVGSILREGGVGASAEREPDGTWVVGPAFELQIPIWDFGQAAVPRARARMRQACQRLTATAIRVRSRSQSTVLRVASLSRRVAHYRDQLLPLRQQVLDRTHRQYNAMQTGTFELLLAKRQQIATGQAYVLTLRDYWIARSELDQILSGSLPNHVGEPSGSIRMPGPMTGGDEGGHD